MSAPSRKFLAEYERRLGLLPMNEAQKRLCEQVARLCVMPENQRKMTIYEGLRGYGALSPARRMFYRWMDQQHAREELLRVLKARIEAAKS